MNRPSPILLESGSDSLSFGEGEDVEWEGCRVEESLDNWSSATEQGQVIKGINGKISCSMLTSNATV